MTTEPEPLLPPTPLIRSEDSDYPGICPPLVAAPTLHTHYALCNRAGLYLTERGDLTADKARAKTWRWQTEAALFATMLDDFSGTFDVRAV